MKSLLFSLLLIAPLALPNTAAAQDDYEDLDGDSGAKKAKQKKAAKNVSGSLDEEVIREIQRGFFIKSNLGSTAYLIKYGNGILRPGTTLSMGIGNDFSDQEDSSMAWEVYFHQGVHNGMHYDQQAALNVPCNTPADCRLIQGDTRTFALIGAGEYSRYLTRRLGIGVRAGAGVMFSPLLMDATAFEDEVVRDAWSGRGPSVHSNPHPMAQGGPTFEYYTKLSHFSVGLDVDVSYVLGFDLGAGGSAYLKYTF